MSSFSTESRGFIIVTIVGSGAGLALSVTNAVFYSKARSNCNSLSSNTANIMMWLNIILSVIFGIMLIWAFYRLVVHPDLRNELGQKVSDYVAGSPDGPVTQDRFEAAKEAAQSGYSNLRSGATRSYSQLQNAVRQNRLANLGRTSTSPAANVITSGGRNIVDPESFGL